ncbi:hypothetical protein SISSUDRAFT_1043767 [Sistotremastrum suecicum HHB10207 ss-3]|uniref:Uncharacterized protein n=1 Tax=Sistotremastrum suecicum HHB10207 ss-3 TaxID=1314776 RepID=A0A166FMH4_9AGAM|nr:hypothetical protein SISSUDRAFT_1043767 [Sistotremastrum suecicum HHB10207 ss-3]
MALGPEPLAALLLASTGSPPDNCLAARYISGHQSTGSLSIKISPGGRPRFNPDVILRLLDLASSALEAPGLRLTQHGRAA